MAKRATAINAAGVQLAIAMLEELQDFHGSARRRTVDQHRQAAAEVLAKARSAGSEAENAFLGVMCDVIARCHVGQLPVASAYRGLLAAQS